jgi:hypothetical protein
MLATDVIYKDHGHASNWLARERPEVRERIVVWVGARATVQGHRVPTQREHRGRRGSSRRSLIVAAQCYVRSRVTHKPTLVSDDEFVNVRPRDIRGEARRRGVGIIQSRSISGRD